MARDLRRKAKTGTVIRIFEDRSRLIEWDNGRRQRISFAICPLCKKERPATNFAGALCFDCKNIKLEVAPGFEVKREGKTLKYRSERYARLRQATPPWVDPKEIKAKFAEAKRLTEETGILHHVDHIWPLQHEDFCGLNVPWNLRVIPAVKNMSKHNKPPLAYLQQIT